MARSLFAAMWPGGSVGFDSVPHFNGGLFDNDATLPMDRTQVDIAYRAASLDWSEIDPSILGTLFERGLNPAKRSQLGAHYTDRDRFMRIIDPVVVQPLLGEWDAKRELAQVVEQVDSACTPYAAANYRRRGHGLFVTFLERLRASPFSTLPADRGTICTFPYRRSRLSNAA